MSKAYLVAHIRIHDKEAFEKFKAMSGPAIADHGGRVLARVETGAGADLGPLLIGAGLGRAYDGGKRKPWC